MWLKLRVPNEGGDYVICGAAPQIAAENGIEKKKVTVIGLSLFNSVQEFLWR
jgi:hypothetical protein